MVFSHSIGNTLQIPFAKVPNEVHWPMDFKLGPQLLHLSPSWPDSAKWPGFGPWLVMPVIDVINLLIIIFLCFGCELN